jgi:hypothetical protein
MNIICLLSVSPCIKTYNFYKSIQLHTKYDVYIVIDNNSYNIPDYDGVVKIIKIDNNECEKNGFKSTVLWLNNKACARDKALYYFTRASIDFNYIWFIEEDVFVPSIYTIENIDKKYGEEHDLLVKGNGIIHERQTEWHWNHINEQIKIEPPYANSMICAIRCSKELLNCINVYAKTYNNLFLDEALFNTLAFQNNLRVLCIDELSTIEWRKDWNKSDIVDTNLYHPIKNIDLQYYYRNE